MLIDQLTPHLPKDNKEVNAHMKCLQAMLNATVVVDPTLDLMMKHRVMSLTTDRIITGTRQAISLHRRNTTEDETGMTEICTMSSVAEMHAVGLKTSIRSASTSNRRRVKKRTMTTTVPIMTNLTNSVLTKGA
jgi:hypothetical protein